jgi:stage V sporulation protein AD
LALKKIGAQTVKLENMPSIIGSYSIVGPKEGKGPLKKYFDLILEDDLWGQKTFEKAETKIQEECIKSAIDSAGLSTKDIDYLVTGDLLSQIIASAYAARQLAIPYFGLYGACSTMSESLSLSAMIVDGGFADKVVSATSSHFSTAERQFRFPLEYGNQRKLSAQWTATAAGATILSSMGNGPYIKRITTGKIIDPGIKDATNMGAAMAPAAVDTLINHFQDTGFDPSYYDLIVSGDLGYVGKDIVIDMMKKQGYDLTKNYTDCGVEIYDKSEQDTHAGGSGCGCSASVFNGYILKEMATGKLEKVLLMSTGALHSTLITQQGESIPGIAHAVAIENKRN